MRVAWLTPFNVRSAIGEFSRHVTTALADLAEVDIWTSDDSPLLPTTLPLVGYRRGGPQLDDLASYDAIVYNLGNFLEFHHDIYCASQEHPGVVILHDRALHHFFAELWLNGPHADPGRYIARMEAHYGEDGALAAAATLEGHRAPVWESENEILQYPLSEEVLANAIGAVVHSTEQASDLQRRWVGPVAALHLPCYSEHLSSVRSGRTSQSSERVRLLTVGHVNPNKQIHKVIEMLASNPVLARRVEYRIAGPDDDHAYVSEIRQLVSSGPEVLKVELLGWLPDTELDREMAEADVFMNLRYPNIEGSSASLMRQLAYGRPIMCFNSGIFSELPASSVIRVAIGDFDALNEQLARLVDDPSSRSAVGRAARDLADSYTESRYASGLLGLLQRSRTASPALRFLTKLGHELGQMRVDRELPVFDVIADDFAQVLDF